MSKRRKSISIQKPIYDHTLAYAESQSLSVSSITEVAIKEFLAARGVPLPDEFDVELRELSPGIRNHMSRAWERRRDRKKEELDELARGHFTF